LPALGITLVALLALGALFGSASASAATQHWYGYAGGTKLAEKTPTEVIAEDEGGATLKFTIAGIGIEIECNSTSAGGKIENPSGGGGGTLDGATIKFEECTMTKPAGCAVPSTIGTFPLKGEAAKFEGLPAIKYSPVEGTAVITFSMTGASCPGFLQGSKTITGSFMAEYTGYKGRYWVGTLSSKGLEFGGSSTVQLMTESQLASKSGKAVALATDLPGVEHWYLDGPPAGGAKTKFAEGSSVSYSAATGSATHTISSTIVGLKLKIQCGGPSSSIWGSVENPAGGGAGSAAATMAFAGCSVVEPAGKGCTAEAAAKPLSGLATESAKLPAVTLSPAEKTTIATVTIGGASCPGAMKGNRDLTGSLTGVPDPYGNYAFSGNAALTLGGQAATFAGQATLETSTGERLGIAP
jgi:hypothetical protein